MIGYVKQSMNLTREERTMKRYKIVCSKGVLKGACTEAMAELKAKNIFKKYPDVKKIYLYTEDAKVIYKVIERK